MTDTVSLEFTDLRGQTLIKNPGSIQGESFTLRNLTDCRVFLVDYTSEVEVTNCINCQIFIGPVDGPAIFDRCTNCQVAVACQQFQAKNCDSCAFELYCATGPTLSGCSSIKVSCWSATYPGLTNQFAAANLDPKNNQWNKVYDASAPLEGDFQNFTLSMTPSEPWEVPIEGAPVPVLDGAPQQSVGVGGDIAEPADSLAAGVQDLSLNNDFPPGENGLDRSQTAAEAAIGFTIDPPVTADARDRLRQRLAAQAHEESEKKTALQASASQYLADFYDARNKAKEDRIKAGRDELARRGSSEVGPEGNTQWERAISMIDFNMMRPSGTDLSRFKSVLLACKDRALTA